jgi:Leucine-rich repeat (LRR) protein
VAAGETGAPDSTGFRISLTLEAGAYDVRVLASGAGAITVYADEAEPSQFPDEALDACLRRNSASLDDPEAIVELHCVAASISSLDGIESLSSLESLELAENSVEDLTPLASLTRLRVLGLAGNRVTDLQALANLPRLNFLNLGRDPLTPAALADLEPLADQLRGLDLAGIEGLSEDDLAALRESLPNTVIVSPDGDVLP